MSAQLYSLTHGTSGLATSYIVVVAAMVGGLIRSRAAAKKYLVAPLYAVPLLLLVGVCNATLGAALEAVGSRSLWVQLALGLALLIVIGSAGGRILALQSSVREPKHLRGAFVSRAPVKKVREARSNMPVTLAGIPISLADETKHFKIIGTTGTGKSTAIREILDAALSRGDRAIIADPDGGYLNRYYDPKRGDVILNPFDADSHKWSLFGEITEDYDIDELARALIPDSGEEDRIWDEYARTLFTQVIRQMRSGDNCDDRELSRLLNKADDDELNILLEDTSAARFFKDGSEKMLASTQSVLASAVRALEHISRHEAPPLSVRAWVREGRSGSAESRGKVLFLPYKAVEIAALRRLISAWMRLSIFEAMNCEESDQRLWFIIDELDALGAIDGLKDALARLRKFGGRCVLGFQSIAQVSGLYGKGTAETIVENCSNTLILRCSASERGGTSEFASKLIGQREVMHTTISTTRRSSQWGSSTSENEQLRIEPAVMASEIERLPDLAGFLKIASVPDWRVATLTVKSEHIVPRNRETRASTLAPSSTSSAPCVDAISSKAQRVPRKTPKTRSRKKDAPKSGRRAKSDSPSAREIDTAGDASSPLSRSGTSGLPSSDVPDPR
jgi:hypothetical protein